jgi:O-acetyl-ADP-ribose deacetylase (regulator of RNase III)
MISERTGDLLEQNDLTHIAHQANLYHTFGAGLAAQIADKYPSVVRADKRTQYGAIEKQGSYSMAWGDRKTKRPVIVNLYTQNGKGGTNYHAMEHALSALEKQLAAEQQKADRPAKLGLPYRLGCGIAGGNWAIVSGIIDKVFMRSPVEVVICTRAEDKLAAVPA